MKLQLSKEKAIDLYPDSPKELQVIMEETFGKETFQKTDWRTIDTFDKACRECFTTEEEFNNFWTVSRVDDDTIAYEKLKIITKALNQGWTPDWDDSSQKKWWPWFRLSSGFGFDFSFCYCDRSFTYVGSRLCFESKEKSNHAAKHFLSVYEQFQK